MRFVHQHRHAPLVELGEAEQQGMRIEVVVVVGDQHVDPARHFLAQVVRANLMGQGHFAQVGTVEQRQGCGSLTRCRQAVVKAGGQWARFTMTGFVGVLTGFVAGDQLQCA
ncbi:hypothetical protein D3C76_1482570 [compost metagenome]